MKREFEEETGYRCRRITYMGALKIVPSRINNTLYVFFGKGAELLSGRKKDKDSELILVTPDEFRKLVLNGGCVDSSSVAMFQLAQLRGFL
jgi:8-oxo-dGTP pyrophosphatase MutT (NUDIX family)